MKIPFPGGQRLHEQLVDQVSEGAGKDQQPGGAVTEAWIAPAVQDQKNRRDRGQAEPEDRRGRPQTENEPVVKNQAKFDVFALLAEDIDFRLTVTQGVAVYGVADLPVLMGAEVERQAVGRHLFADQVRSDQHDEYQQPDRRKHAKERLRESKDLADQLHHRASVRGFPSSVQAILARAAVPFLTVKSGGIQYIGREYECDRS